MLIHEGHVYAVTDEGIALCWKADTGAELWKHRLGGDTSASPLLVDGHILAPNEKGKTYVFRANPAKFDPVAENQLGTETFASPVAAGDRLYLRVASGTGEERRETLYCIGSP